MNGRKLKCEMVFPEAARATLSEKVMFCQLHLALAIVGAVGFGVYAVLDYRAQAGPWALWMVLAGMFTWHVGVFGWILRRTQRRLREVAP